MLLYSLMIWDLPGLPALTSLQPVPDATVHCRSHFTCYHAPSISAVLPTQAKFEQAAHCTIGSRLLQAVACVEAEISSPALIKIPRAQQFIIAQ